MKKVLRNWLLVLCASIIVIVGVLGVVLNISGEKAYASENLFEMVDGASVKINDDGGIRFKVKMDENTKNKIVNNEGGDDVKLYFLVTTQEIFNQVEDDTYYETLTAKASRAIVIEADESKIYKNGSDYFVNACVTNILEENRKLDYVALAVIETVNGADKTYDYASVDGKTVDNADFSIANVRGNVYNILSQAVLDCEENYTASIFQSNAYKSWFGKEEYPLVIKSLAQYESLIKKINGGNDFANIEINVKDTFNKEDATVELDSGKKLPEVKSFYTVTFCNEDGSVYKQVEVEKGQTAVAEEPTKEQTAEYTYAFENWVTAIGGDTVQPLTNITASTTVYAKFSQALRKYNIVWKNYDDSTLKTESIEYGLVPSYAETFNEYTVDGDLNVYAFTGWDTTPVAVTSDATYKAVFSAKDHYVASTLEMADKGQYCVDIGNAVITRTTDTSELPADVSYGYKVTGTFDNIYTRMNHYVYGNFKAGESYRFTVKYKGLDVDNLSHFHFAFSGSYGTDYNINVSKTISKVITMTEDTTKLKFTSWLRESQNEGQGKTVTGDTMSFVFNIEFEKVEQYTITFKNAEGDVLDTQVVVAGEVPVYGGEEVAYTGSIPAGIVRYEMGWDKKLVSATEDTTYTLQFSPVYTQKTVLYSEANNGNKSYEVNGMDIYRTTESAELPNGASSAYVIDVPANASGENATFVSYINGTFEAGKTYMITFKLKLLAIPWWVDLYIGMDSGFGSTKAGQLNGWGPTGDIALALLSDDGYSITKSITETTNQIYTVMRTQNPNYNNSGTPNALKEFKYALSIEYKEVNFYTITWKNGETTVETDENVMEGTIPTYNGNTPVFDGTLSAGITSMEFVGWSPEISAVTDNVTYTAQYIPVCLHQVVKVPDDKVGTYLHNYENETIEYTTDSTILPTGASYGWKITGSLSYGMYHQFVNKLNGNFKAGEKYRIIMRVKCIELGEIDRIRIDPTGAYGNGFYIGDIANGKTTVYTLTYEIPNDATTLVMTSCACKWNTGSSDGTKVSQFVVSLAYEKITDTYDITMTDVSWRRPNVEEFIYTEDADKLPAGTTFAYIYKAVYTTGNTSFLHNVKGDFKKGTTYSFTIKVKEVGSPCWGSVYLDPTGNYATTYNLINGDNKATGDAGLTFTYTPTADTTCIVMSSVVNINGWAANNVEYAYAFNITCNGEVTE